MSLDSEETSTNRQGICPRFQAPKATSQFQLFLAFWEILQLVFCPIGVCPLLTKSVDYPIFRIRQKVSAFIRFQKFNEIAFTFLKCREQEKNSYFHYYPRRRCSKFFPNRDSNASIIIPLCIHGTSVIEYQNIVIQIFSGISVIISVAFT